VPADIKEVETELPETQPQKRRGPWPLIVIVVVLTLIAVWLVPGEDDEVADILASAPPSLLQEQAQGMPMEDSAPTADILPIPQPLVDDRPGAKARALIAEMRASGTILPDEVFAAAVAAQESGELQDAYLLYFFAAREGHTEAALMLAQQADPATHTVEGSVFEAPDLVQAHKWYQMAARQGNETAQAGLADLRARVDRLAADGDPEAQRIALLWQ
jgi:TPR repeat protein